MFYEIILQWLICMFAQPQCVVIYHRSFFVGYSSLTNRERVGLYVVYLQGSSTKIALFRA